MPPLSHSTLSRMEQGQATSRLAGWTGRLFPAGSADVFTFSTRILDPPTSCPVVTEVCSTDVTLSPRETNPLALSKGKARLNSI
jgi:hypothetical protein